MTNQSNAGLGIFVKLDNSLRIKAMARILVIEDDEAIRENLALLLDATGYEVLEASDGEAGLAIATSTQPDLIICDIRMPKMDGFKVAEVIRKTPATKMIRFIFLTAKVERQAVRTGMVHADDYIEKPFSSAELLTAVEAQLNRAEMVAEFLDFARQEARQQIGRNFTDRVGNLLNNIAGCFNELAEASSEEEKQLAKEDGVRAIAELYGLWLTYLRMKRDESQPEVAAEAD